MLSFVIPLRSKRVSADWSLVSGLARSTVASACNQTHSEFRVVLVCHEVPEWVSTFPQCTVVRAPFPPPDAALMNPEERLLGMRTDKGRKVLLGMAYCIKSGGGHVMVLDADDWVSNRLAGFVADNPASNGWYIECGYRHDTVLPFLVYPRKRFYHECGSSIIVNAQRMPFPAVLDLSKDMNDQYVRRYEVHAYVPDCMARMGTPLDALPFPGAIYNINSQSMYATPHRRKDSWFRLAGRVILKGRYFSRRLRREFGVQ